MHNAVIAGYIRSPFTISYKGELKSLRPEDILAQVINKLISPSNLNKNDIEDVIVGCAFPEVSRVSILVKLSLSCVIFQEVLLA